MGDILLQDLKSAVDPKRVGQLLRLFHVEAETERQPQQLVPEF